jgi:hypothetical protein
MLRKRAQALASVDCELAVLLGELLIHNGLGSAEDRPDAVRDYQADDAQQCIIANGGSFAHLT